MNRSAKKPVKSKNIKSAKVAVKKAAILAPRGKGFMPKVTAVRKEGFTMQLHASKYGSKHVLGNPKFGNSIEFSLEKDSYKEPVMFLVGEREVYTVKGADAPSQKLAIYPQPFLLFEKRDAAQYNKALELFHQCMGGREHLMPERMSDCPASWDKDEFAYAFAQDPSDAIDAGYPGIVSEKYLAEYLLHLVKQGVVHTDAVLYGAGGQQKAVADYVAPLWPKLKPKLNKKINRTR